MVIIFVILLSMFSPLAFAQAGNDDCTLSLDALEPLLDAKAPSVKKLLFSKKDLKHRRLTESLLLADGATVTYSVGGCAHYSYDLRYDTTESVPAKEREAMDAALRLLKQTPVIKKKEGIHPLLAVLIDALERAISFKGSQNKFENGILLLNCGDANCEIEVKGKSLTVKYDFAL